MIAAGGGDVRLREDLEHVLDHTRDLWSELDEARIFITGGTGFFGSWLLESLALARNQLRLRTRVVLLTRDVAKFCSRTPHLAGNDWVETVQGDISNFAFPEGQFSHVIHAAIDYTSPLDTFTSTIAGTRRTLELAVTSGASKYLLMSSGAVYGEQPTDLFYVPETYRGAPDPVSMKSSYGIAKRASEFLCTAFHEKHGLEATIARGFAFVGPYLPLHAGSAVGNFIGNALSGSDIAVNGDGTPYRSYLYGADLAIWLWRILLRGKPAYPYNVGSDVSVTISEVAHAVAEIINPDLAVRIAHSAPPGAAPSRYVPAITRAKRELGLDSWIDLREGIRRTAAWHRRHSE